MCIRIYVENNRLSYIHLNILDIYLIIIYIHICRKNIKRNDPIFKYNGKYNDIYIYINIYVYIYMIYIYDIYI